MTSSQHCIKMLFSTDLHNVEINRMFEAELDVIEDTVFVLSEEVIVNLSECENYHVKNQTPRRESNQPQSTCANSTFQVWN